MSFPGERPHTCDLCECGTPVPGYEQQAGGLRAYRVLLCETCFFLVLLYVRQEREIQRLFEDDPLDDRPFGLVSRSP
jgi:hypothetical protein